MRSAGFGTIALGFAQAEYQGDYPASEKNNARRGRKFFAAFGLDTDFGVPELYSVILAVRDWHDERKNSQYQQQDPNNR